MSGLFVKTVLAFSCLFISGCATKNGTAGDTLERSVKDYNRMLRWHEIESALTSFAAEPELEASLLRAGDLRKQGLSVTDFRVISTSYHAEKSSGEAVAEFDYYILPSNRVKTVLQRQQWRYIKEAGSWKITTGLPDFE